MELGWGWGQSQGQGQGKGQGKLFGKRRLPSRHTLKMAVKKILTW